MGLSLVNGPTLEPITLGEVKQHCRVSSADDDGLLAGYMLAARHFVEGETRKALMTQTWDYTIDDRWPCVAVEGYWRRRIELPKPPLQSVASVSYVDPSGNVQTLSAASYVVRTDKTFGIIDQAYGVTWPDVRCQAAAITVRMVCGFGSNPGDVPDDLRHAMLFHVEGMLDRDPQSTPTLERTRDALISGNRSIRL